MQHMAKAWDLPRGASSAHLLTQFARERGMTVPAVLDGSGVAAETLPASPAEVTADQEFRMLRNVVRHCGDEPGLGIEMGRRYHLSLYGAWGLALTSSPTVREAVRTGLRYLDLTYALTRVTHHYGDREAALLVDDRDVPPAVRTVVIERTMSTIQTIGGDLVPGGIPLSRVTFRHQAGADTTRHREAFGVEPVFGACASAIYFDARLLELPLPQANDWTLRFSEQVCQELLAGRRQRAGFTGTVREMLRRRPERVPDQATVAAALNVSTRTLLRRLAQEGTSFRALLDEVRESIAEELLCAAGMTTEQVSARLGYSDAASFVRAFKRWKGVPPQAYRAAARDAAAVPAGA